MSTSIEKSPQFQVFKTLDGSLSLALPGGEAMHSKEGAFSETLYIYLPVLDALKSAQVTKISLFSLGLGVGYVEWMVAAWLLTHPEYAGDFRLITSEIDTELVQSFKNFLDGSHVQHPYFEAFHDASLRSAEHFGLSQPDLIEFLRRALESQSWQISPALTHPLNSEDFPYLFNGIFYDAFSSSTDSYLWSQEFLESFIEKLATPLCVLATYACKSTLTKALKHHGFAIEKKKGFAYKRESTLAFRNC